LISPYQIITKFYSLHKILNQITFSLPLSLSPLEITKMSSYLREQFDLFEVQLYNQYYSYKQFDLFEVQLYNSYYSYKQFNLFEKLLESRRLF
jgi:hypothetical protein